MTLVFLKSSTPGEQLVFRCRSETVSYKQVRLLSVRFSPIGALGSSSESSRENFPSSTSRSGAPEPKKGNPVDRPTGNVIKCRSNAM